MKMFKFQPILCILALLIFERSLAQDEDEEDEKKKPKTFFDLLMQELAKEAYDHRNYNFTRLRKILIDDWMPKDDDEERRRRRSVESFDELPKPTPNEEDQEEWFRSNEKFESYLTKNGMHGLFEEIWSRYMAFFDFGGERTDPGADAENPDSEVETFELSN